MQLVESESDTSAVHTPGRQGVSSKLANPAQLADLICHLKDPPWNGEHGSDPHQTDFMIEKPTKPGRGGARKGSGPKKDLRRACEILAIANSWLVSESHARRIWERGGLTRHVCAKSFAIFASWDSMSEAKRLTLYAALREQVDANRSAGWTRKWTPTKAILKASNSDPWSFSIRPMSLSRRPATEPRTLSRSRNGWRNWSGLGGLNGSGWFMRAWRLLSYETIWTFRRLRPTFLWRKDVRSKLLRR